MRSLVKLAVAVLVGCLIWDVIGGTVGTVAAHRQKIEQALNVRGR